YRRCSILHPPTSPPFPSTTLFRSQLTDLGRIVVSVCIFPAIAEIGLVAVEDDEPAVVEDAERLRGFSDDGRLVVFYSYETDLGKDRKSTRLNSSHVKISYAVFCLK